MALHEQSVGKTDEWYTPPHVFAALDMWFDVDVASPGQKIVPWVTAYEHITQHSLSEDWGGDVWMNPPFGGRNGLVPWLIKFFAHGRGICLVPDRTSAPWWQVFAPEACSILFVTPKLKFIGADGKPGESPAQGTSLFALGRRNVEALERAADNGLGFLCTPKLRPIRSAANNAVSA